MFENPKIRNFQEQIFEISFFLPKTADSRVSRITGSGWDPYTRFLVVPILKVVRNIEILCALKLFDEWYD